MTTHDAQGIKDMDEVPKCECGATTGRWLVDKVWYCPECYTSFVRRKALEDAEKAIREVECYPMDETGGEPLHPVDFKQKCVAAVEMLIAEHDVPAG